MPPQYAVPVQTLPQTVYKLATPLATNATPWVNVLPVNWVNILQIPYAKIVTENVPCVIN